jgi:hypothetical protein
MNINNLPWILDLTNHQIGDEEVTDLAYHLKNGKKIKLLYLSGNNITDKGLVKLAESVKENTVLENLYLQSNKNTVEGIISLLKILRWRKKQIETIFIDLNTKISYMKDRDLERLIKCLIDFKINHGYTSFYINTYLYIITDNIIIKKIKKQRNVIYNSLRNFIDDIAIDIIYQYLFDYQVKKLISMTNDITINFRQLYKVIY